MVFWDDLLETLRDSDPVTADDISCHAFRWIDQVVHVQGRQTAHLGGYGFRMSRRHGDRLKTEVVVEPR